MSISISGRIKEKCINNDLINLWLKDFFGIIDLKESDEKNCLTFEVSYKSDKLQISFIEEKKFPYNIFDSEITNDEFEYNQLITFDINKELATFENIQFILNFFIYIKKQVNSQILVTSDIHNDICLLKNEEVIYSKYFSNPVPKKS